MWVELNRSVGGQAARNSKHNNPIKWWSQLGQIRDKWGSWECSNPRKTNNQVYR